MAKFLIIPGLLLLANITFGQTITVTPISPLTYCAGSQVSVSFTTTGTFNPGNIFTAQLSNATGSFTAADSIGSLNSTSSGTILATIPPGKPGGSAYRIRVRSSNPVVTSADNGSDITITPLPVVSVAASPSSVICPGRVVTFTATSTNAGSPTYQWTKNGVAVSGATSSTYVDSMLLHNDTIRAMLTNSTTCATGGTISSGPIVMIVSALPPIITPFATPANVCTGGTTQLRSGVSQINFSVTSIPYQNIPVPAGAGTGPTGDDNLGSAVTIPFTFNFFGNNYTSFIISTNGNIQFGPSFSGSYTPGPLPNTSVKNFVALCWADVVVASNGNSTGVIKYFVDGSAPTRRMIIDFSNCAFYSGGGSTGSMSGQIWLYESTRLVEVHLKNSIGLASTGGGVKVLGVNNATGTIGAAAPGRNGTAWQTSIPEAWRFTPPEVYTYAWTPTSTLSSDTAEAPIASPTVNTTYHVIATNQISGCIGAGDVTVNILPTLTPTVTMNITTGNNPSCSTSVVIFRAEPVNGGSTPAYQWQKNGINIGGATAQTYTTTTLSNNDVIRVIMTSNYQCLTVTKDTSNEITMSIIGVPPVTENISVAACNSVVYRGVTYYFSTVKRDTLKSVIGCDSVYIVATITITHITPVTRDTSLSACNANVVYMGNTYTQTTIKRDTVRSVQGCDSVYNNAYITVTFITPLSPPVNMLPVNNVLNLNKPVNFSWGPVSNALLYDLYLWKDTSPVPTVPIAANLSVINLSYDGSLLQYGTAYKWKVAAKNGACQTPSAVQNFTTRHLPDLIVKNIINPASAFSGQSITINWEVQDTGRGGTLNQQWLDLVYISTDAILDQATDPFLGTKQNVSELNPNQSYLQSATFTLPQGINNNYYVIIVTNGYGQLLEGSTANNTKISAFTTLINLTPPPDLRVTSVVAPNFTFSGQPFTFTYQVSNLGTGPTIASSWYDYFYITKDSVLNTATAIFLGSQFHNAALPVSGAYTHEKTFNIPDTSFGKHYVFVRTDVFNNVYEHASENNNTGRSDSINILLTPPIDLTVTQVIIPDSASNGEQTQIRWRIQNIGASSTENRVWNDRVYLSRLSVFNPDSLIVVGTIARVSHLDPGDGYNSQLNIVIPPAISGNYYVYVKTDVQNNIFEFSNEGNNVLRSTLPLKIISPDLVVARITVPTADSSGRSIDVSWLIKNNGTGVLFSGVITDRISVSTSTTYNAVSVTEIGRVSYNSGQMLNGDTIPKNAQLTLPNGISGPYYVYIETDYTNKVFEGLKENNNVSRSNAIQVTLTPWPDLVVTAITAPDSAINDQVIAVSFTVKNNGPGTLPVSAWTDKVYLSKSPVFFTPDTIFIRGLDQVRALEVNSSYMVNAAIKIPANIPDSMRYYLYLFADGDKDIYEHTAEGNNASLKDSIFIKKYPPVDIAVTSLSAPDSTSSGNTIPVQWTVSNVGPSSTQVTQWKDGLYLSTDTSFNKNSDILVGEVTHNGALTTTASYTGINNFNIPNGVSGNYYLLMVTDHNDLNHDINKYNNYKLVEGSNDTSKIHITLTPPCDLRIESFIIPDQGIAGQPVKAKYTIKNYGIGATVPGSWMDRIYLSTNISLDLGDQAIGSKIRTAALNPGVSYTDSMDVYLPIGAIGNYVVILKTDAAEAVYEHLNENNNTYINSITVVRPPLSDLVVTNIVLPGVDAIAGDSVTLQWTLKNIGSNPASGYMKEAVYFSEDTVKDAGDVLIASLDRYINLGPQMEISHSYSGRLTGVSLKPYHVIVHTDVVNNIYESIDSNNVKASPDMLNVTVPVLPINVLTQRNMADNREVYYRIIIPEGLQGESLLITMKGDSVNGANELYLRFGDVPSRALYDYSHNDPFRGNQEIIIPELRVGTYYLMAYGQTSVGNTQLLSLLAKVLQFEIRNVEANKGGNTGPTTIQVNGSKLGTVNRVVLRKGVTTIEGDSIRIIDPTKLFVTFNLAGASLGDYDVIGYNHVGNSAVLPLGFKVVPGMAVNLLTNVVTPPSTRPSNIISISVQFINAGNTDIRNPILQLSSLGGAPISFTLEGLSANLIVLTLPLKELNGPPGILRPGAGGTIIVYAKASTALGFMLLGE